MARRLAQILAWAGSAGQGILRVRYLTPHARQSKIKEPPKTSALRSESQMSCGTLEVSDDNAAPMPSVIMTAGSVQQIKVERLVSSAIVGAAVSRNASFALLTNGPYDFAGGINSLPSLRDILVVV